MSILSIFLIFILIAFPNEFKSLEKKLMETKTVKVIFEQRIKYSWYPKEDISRGIFYASKEGFLRIDYTMPDRITIFSDGKKVYIINYDEEEVYVDSIKRNQSPVIESLFLFSKPLSEVFEYIGKTVKGGHKVLILKPKEKDEIVKEVHIYLDDNGEIVQLKTYDSEETETTIEFIEVFRNFTPSQELFKIRIPEGFKVESYG